jgi:hypothetical protein
MQVEMVAIYFRVICSHCRQLQTIQTKYTVFRPTSETVVFTIQCETQLNACRRNTRYEAAIIFIIVAFREASKASFVSRCAETLGLNDPQKHFNEYDHQVQKSKLMM